MYGQIRTRLGFRRKDRKPDRFILTAEMPNGSIEKREIDPKEVHAPIVIPHFNGPRVLGRKAGPADTPVIWPPEFGASAKAKEGGGKIGYKIQANMPRFGQMLAKIGLGVAVSHFGVRGFHPLVRDFIRFLPNDYFHWVGGSREVESKTRNYHEIELRIETNKYGRFIIAYIRLFARWGALTNFVVVGKPLGPDKFGRDHDVPARRSG
jgi:hypothetical protein